MTAHAPDCACFVCCPESRGSAVKAPLSDSEPSLHYALRLPQSLRDRAKAAGPGEVRRILDEYLPK